MEDSEISQNAVDAVSDFEIQEPNANHEMLGDMMEMDSRPVEATVI